MHSSVSRRGPCRHRLSLARGSNPASRRQKAGRLLTDIDPWSSVIAFRLHWLAEWDWSAALPSHLAMHLAVAAPEEFKIVC